MDQFQVFDFHRIFLGDAPAGFLLEIVFRTVIMYTYAVALLRILGKRSMGQLSTLEVAIIISFGSAIGDPMMGADIPILHGIVAVTVVALLQIGLEYVINSNKKLEAVMEGQPDCLVREGIILVDQLKKSNMSHQDLFRSLRLEGIEHLGLVKYAFFETSGSISVLRQHPVHAKHGLPLMPDDPAVTLPQYTSDDDIPENHHYSCMNCGLTLLLEKHTRFPYCPGCQEQRWTSAVNARSEG